MISVRNVDYAIGDTPILVDINLTLPAGGVTALIGPNGAGKSTLLSLIARLKRPVSGRIEVAGIDLSETTARRFARHVAVMAQDTTLPGRLTVGELVSYGRFPHHRGQPRESDRALVAETLDAFDLTALAPRFLETLSGGQRQLARIAMAFAQQTDVVLLDEPLNNLDFVHARRLMGRLRAIADTSGRTVVVVLHDINQASAWADRVVAMREGRLVAHGETNEVICKSVLHEVFAEDLSIVDVEGRKVVLAF